MKNALIAGVVGLLFMVGGFVVGFKMMPKPPTPPAPVTTQSKAEPGAPAVANQPAPDAITMETLRKASESMMSLNQALTEREKHVGEREAKAREREEQLSAERAALDATHEKFKALYNDFLSRLQIVEASQLEQLHKQAELYNSMGPDQAIELMRATDDNAMTRLFSVMETKPLAKLVTQWKTKYPADTERLLRALDNTAQVQAKDKIAINDPFPAAAAPASVTPESSTPAAPPQPQETAPPTDAAPNPPTLAPTPEPKAPVNSVPATTSNDVPVLPTANEQPATDTSTPGATAEALGESAVTTTDAVPTARHATLAITETQPPRAQPVTPPIKTATRD